eukprot:TRINITY_DN1615_c0_g1_i2.p1 TRINITY_DN1615_c0_g1~~TRINITY_DN1615_c0_g1_i2.p1  ORF type:complete len:421 (+),score=95.41 TRINITY_DN1615_c0_g1_i2:66-1265(+)
MMRSVSLCLSAFLIGQSSAKVEISQRRITRSNGEVVWYPASRLDGTKSWVGQVEYLDIPSFATDYNMMMTDMAITDSGANFKAECTNEGSNGDCYLFYSLGEDEPIRYKNQLKSEGFKEGECAPRAKSMWGDQYTSMTTFYRRIPLGQKVEFTLQNFWSMLMKAVIFNHQDESEWVCHGKSSSTCEVEKHAAGHEFAGAPLCVWSQSSDSCERNWCPSPVPAAADPTVLLNGVGVPGVPVAGAASLSMNGASLVLPLRNFLQPTFFHGMAAGVQPSDELQMVCPAGSVNCLFYIITYHCPPFSTDSNGGIPSLVSNKWEARSFGPNFLPPSAVGGKNGDMQPTIIFRKEVLADESEMVKFDRPGTYVGVFSQHLPGLDWDEAKVAFSGPFTAKTCKPIR